MQGNIFLETAGRLYEHLHNRHWNGQALVGPDPVGKIHWRITRFIRSYLPGLPFDDEFIYLQGQAYWIKANLLLHQMSGEQKYRDVALRCADYIVAVQPEDGAWLHPPIWGRRGFISTVEGVWASLGLLAAFRYAQNETHFNAASKWYEFQVHRIGFEEYRGGLAARYYLHSRTEMVPNVSTMLLWLMAELADLSGKSEYLRHADRLVRFIELCRSPDGELPYAVGARPHFQCYQYNSFQFMDLLNYMNLTGDATVAPILKQLASYLATGLTERGSCRCDCFRENPETNYWTLALATALWLAEKNSLGPLEHLHKAAYLRILSRQNHDGSFHFSDKNYEVLTDARSYPRQQAMMLYFLLERGAVEATAVGGGYN